MTEEITYWVNKHGNPDKEVKVINDNGSVRSVCNSVNGKVIDQAEFNSLVNQRDLANQVTKSRLDQARVNFEAAQAELQIQAQIDAQEAYKQSIDAGLPELVALGIARNFWGEYQLTEGN